MEHLRWGTRPTLRRPVVIAAFEGWNDAGDAATLAARWMRTQWAPRQFAEIDPEEFFDFTAARPQVRQEDGHRVIDWPLTDATAGSTGSRDVVVVLDTAIVPTDLEIAAASYERQVTEVVADDDEMTEYVAQLEERFDEQDGVTSPASLVEEVERFLRDQRNN